MIKVLLYLTCLSYIQLEHNQSDAEHGNHEASSEHAQHHDLESKNVHPHHHGSHVGKSNASVSLTIVF